jgi:DNA-binding XRE family transcriptional regulator
MKDNPVLKIECIKAGKTQKQVAREAGINPTLLSMHIHGRYNFSDAEKLAIAEVLNLRIDQIFAE